MKNPEAQCRAGQVLSQANMHTPHKLHDNGQPGANPCSIKRLSIYEIDNQKIGLGIPYGR
jgi:hypothetical protein